MHVILFVMCVYVLVQRNTRRKQGKLRKYMLGAASISFILATADIGVSISMGTRDIDKLINGNTLWFIKKIYPKFLFHLINNMIADILLIIRFYAVWGRKKRFLIIPGFTLAIGTAFGIYSEGTPKPKPSFIWVYVGTIFVSNVVLTLLIAGRIFWISWKAKKILGPQWVVQYNMVAAILIESGFLYSAAIVAQLILAPTKYVLITACIAVRIVCITPLLIIVQVSLGRAVEDLQSTLAMARQSARTRTSTIILDTVITGMSSSHREERQEVIVPQAPAEKQDAKADRRGKPDNV
ncbi:hypothetical protein BDQ17DRAFT_1367413 [Cyathus striatus]|nr:hypothetical protein BDQ17DRAFT_1367413 [Cyathus striatus]